MKCIFFDMSFSLDDMQGVTTYSHELMKRMTNNHPEVKFEGASSYVSIIRNISNYINFYKFHIRMIPLRKKKLYSSSMKAGKTYNELVRTNIRNFVFWANWVPNYAVEGNVITVLHDLNPLYALEGEELIHYKEKITRTINMSKRIITVSEYSKNDICSKFGVDPLKIDVVYNGVDFDNFSRKISQLELEKVKKKYSLPDRFFLYLGSTKKNKNIELIIKSLNKIEDKDVMFVCSNTADYLIELANELKVSDRIIFLKGIDEKDKIAVYQLAKVAIFVSKREGFGLPIIEAQACGTPVIVSNASCLPEIAGKESVKVNPDSESELAERIDALLSDEALRREVIENGKGNAKRFDWNKSAECLWNIFEREFE